MSARQGDRDVARTGSWPARADPLPRAAEVVPADELARALAYAREQLSPATRRAYRADMRIFEVWCAARGLAALPASAETASSFLAGEAASGRAVSTVMRRAAAIRYAHMLAGAEPPTGSPLVTSTCATGLCRRSAG